MHCNPVKTIFLGRGQ